MNCGKVQKNLSAYSDGECDGKTNALIKGHLDNCPECMDELNTLINISKMFAKMEKASAPAELAINVRENLRKAKTADVFYRWSLAAVSALILISGLTAGYIAQKNIGRELSYSVHSEYYAIASFAPLPEETVGGVYFSIMRHGHE
jgi:anti-sigma factor (TIGR02949 family)